MATPSAHPHPHHIPARRLSSFHSGYNPSPADSQHARRQRALEAQKERRTHAFEAARQLARSHLNDLDSMGDLSLAAGAGGAAGQYADASDSDSEGDQRMDSPAPDCSAPAPSKTARKSAASLYKPWARNLLTQGEMLDLARGLPKGLESEWMLKVVPRGRRCLCATGADNFGSNSVLYSRVSGRTLSRHSLPLPPSTLLDTIYDDALGVLWILDVIQWRGRDFVQCDGAVRSFFLTSKLSELGPQPWTPPPSPSFAPTSPPPATSSATHSPLILPCPSLPSPLSPNSLLPVLQALPSPLPIEASIINVSGQPERVQVPLQATGVMLYLEQSHYESGLTALAGWVPLGSEGEGGGRGEAGGAGEVHGVGRFEQLVREWGERGGEASGGME